MFPNKRRNHIESLFGSLSRDVPEDDIGTMRDPNTQARLAAIDDTVRGIESDVRRRESPSPFQVAGINDPAAIAAGVPSDYSSARLPQFHGKMHAAPLDDEINAKLAAMRQPLDPAGPYRSDDPRWDNLRRTMPPKNDAAPLPASPGLLEQIKAAREKAEQETLDRRMNMTTPEREAIDRAEQQRLEIGKQKNAAGQRNLDAGEAAIPNVQQAGMANALMRRARMNGTPVDPLMASLFVRANAPQATTTVNDTMATAGAAPFSGRMNPAMMLLNPGLAQTAMQADATIMQGRERAATEQKAAQNTAILNAARARENQLQQNLAVAKTLEEKQHWERMIRENQDAVTQALGKLSGAGDLMSNLFGGGVAPYQPGGGLSAMPASISSGRTNAIPADPTTASGRQLGELRMVPTPSDLHRFRRLPGLIEGDYAQDTPVPLLGTDGTAEGQEYERRRQTVERFMKPADDVVAKSPWTSFWSSGMTPAKYRAKFLYDDLKTALPNHPDQILRHVVASAMRDPSLAIDDNAWKAMVELPMTASKWSELPTGY